MEQAPVAAIESVSATDSDVYLCPVSFPSGDSCTFPCTVGNVPVSALIDSGSGVSLLKAPLVHTLNVTNTDNGRISLFAVNNVPLSVTGQ